MIGSDPAAVAGVKLSRDVLRRVWRFAQPYRTAIVGFVLVIVAASLLSLAPPLLFRQILDEAIPDADRQQLHVLAALIVLAAIGDAVLALVERYLSSASARASSTTSGSRCSTTSSGSRCRSSPGPRPEPSPAG
jgi:ATP-binding cassette subfamily B protein